MALNSSTVSAGDLATAQQYNDLRSDVVSTSSGHVHDGTLGIGSSKFALLVAGVPLDLQNTTDAASNEVMQLGGGNRGTPTDNDEAFIKFDLDDDLGAQTEFVRFTWKALDVTNTSKDSRPEFQYYTANTLRELVFPAITADDTVAVLTLAQTLANKTLTTPTISATGFANATHAHAATNSGGTLNASAIAAGTLTHERGGLEFDASAITTGGLLMGDSAGAMAILAYGSNGQVLTGTAGKPAWGAVGASSFEAAAEKLVEDATYTLFTMLGPFPWGTTVSDTNKLGYGQFWHMHETSSGTIGISTTIRGGWQLQVTADAHAAAISFGEATLQVSDDWTLVARVNYAESATEPGFHFGLGVQDPNTRGAGNFNNFIGFRLPGGGGNLVGVCDNAGTESTVDEGSRKTGAYTLRIEIRSGGTSVSFYVNNTIVGSAITTNIPSSSAMYASLHVAGNGSNTGTLHVGDVFAWKEV